MLYSSTLQKSELLTTYFDGERGIFMRNPLLPFSIESIHKLTYRYELLQKIKKVGFTILDPLILILSVAIMISSLISLQLGTSHFFSVMPSISFLWWLLLWCYESESPNTTSNEDGYQFVKTTSSNFLTKI